MMKHILCNTEDHTLIAGVCCRCYTQLPKQLTTNTLEQQRAPIPRICSQPLPGLGSISPLAHLFFWVWNTLFPSPTHACAPLLPAIKHSNLQAGSPTSRDASSMG